MYPELLALFPGRSVRLLVQIALLPGGAQLVGAILAIIAHFLFQFDLHMISFFSVQPLLLLLLAGLGRASGLKNFLEVRDGLRAHVFHF